MVVAAAAAAVLRGAELRRLVVAHRLPLHCSVVALNPPAPHGSTAGGGGGRAGGCVEEPELCRRQPASPLLTHAQRRRRHHQLPVPGRGRGDWAGLGSRPAPRPGSLLPQRAAGAAALPPGSAPPPLFPPPFLWRLFLLCIESRLDCARRLA